jgi:hypothetical protein
MLREQSYKDGVTVTDMESEMQSRIQESVMQDDQMF